MCFFACYQPKKYTSKCLLFKIFFFLLSAKNCTCKCFFSCYQPRNCTCKCIFICNCTQKWFFVCYQPRNSTCKCVPVCVGGCVGLSGADVANVRVNVCLLLEKIVQVLFVYLLFFFVSILKQTKQALTGPNVKYQLLIGLPITSAPILAQSKCVRYSKNKFASIQ